MILANLSTFPTTPDTFTTHVDATAADAENIERWKELKAKADKTPSEITEFNNLTSTLAGKIFTADDLNKLQDCIINLETFYSQDIYDYIDQLALSIPLNSPAFTGTPTTPTPETGANNKQIANKEYVDNAIAGFQSSGVSVGSTAPENTNMVWIDKNNGSVAKYYDPETGEWCPMVTMAIWG